MGSLVEILLSDEAAWVALTKITTVEDSQRVGAALVRVFGAEGNDLTLVKYCILMETLHTAQDALLLRGSGIHFAIVAQSGLLHGRPYLQRTLCPLLTDLVHKSSLSFEVDPTRLGDVRELEQNTANLLRLANHVLAALLSSADNMPVTLRRVFEFAYRTAEKKFPSHASRVPKALFFLRVLCPMLVSPEEHGLCKGKCSERAARGLVLLAKLLQSVANEAVPFDKEPYMQPLNSWVESAIPSVKRFFKIALSVVSNECLEVSVRLRKLHAVPNPTASEDAKFLRKFLLKHHEPYRLALLDANAYETLLRVTPLLPATREDSTESSSNSNGSCSSPRTIQSSRSASDRECSSPSGAARAELASSPALSRRADRAAASPPGPRAPTMERSPSGLVSGRRDADAKCGSPPPPLLLSESRRRTDSGALRQSPSAGSAASLIESSSSGSWSKKKQPHGAAVRLGSSDALAP